MLHSPLARTTVTFLGNVLAVVGVALFGAVLGLLVAGRVTQSVGPFHADFELSPSVDGNTTIEIPPFGALILDSHDGPARLTIRLSELDPERTESLISDPEGVIAASNTALEDFEIGMLRLILSAAGAAVLGAILLALLVFRERRRVAWSALVAVLSVGATGAAGILTFRPTAVEEPTYQGLLVNAPAVVGEARQIADRYDEYTAQLQRLVRTVSQLYTTVSTLPVSDDQNDTIRVLHVSDLHLNPAAFDLINTVVDQFNIDIVVDTGDLTDWGSEQEGELYAAGIQNVEAPYVFIPGNHDSEAISAAVAQFPNATVLDNSVVTIAGLTIAGIGDPRFTPDQRTRNTDEYTEAGLRLYTRRLVELIEQQEEPVHVALVHDPASAAPLDGVVPVVLAGHRHERSVTRLDRDTLLMVEGSTGGAGLRGLQQGEPVPLALSILYFSQDGVLRAYDDITVGGTGESEVTLERHVLDDPPGAPSPSASPSASESPSAPPSGPSPASPAPSGTSTPNGR